MEEEGSPIEDDEDFDFDFDFDLGLLGLGLGSITSVVFLVLHICIVFG